MAAREHGVLRGREVNFSIYNSFGRKCDLTGDFIPRGQKIGMTFLDGRKTYFRLDDYDGVVVIPETLQVIQSDPYKGVELDSYQAQLSDAIRTHDHHVIVRANAGSGKTTAACKSLWDNQDSIGEAAMLAFATRDAGDMRRKLPQDVTSGTFHAFAYQMCKQHWRSIKKINKQKERNILDDVVGNGDKDQKMRYLVSEVVGKAKADALLPDDLSAIQNTIQSYGIPIASEVRDEVIEKSCDVLRKSLDIKEHGVDFNDVLWLAATQNVALNRFDNVVVDEAQDLNNAQHVIVQRLIGNGARVISIGDPRQSLYRFRGARTNSMHLLHKMLGATDRDVASLKMPICYRCSRAVLEVAQQYAPDITPCNNAPLGDVSFDYPAHTMLDQVTIGDAILCRINAPLVAIAYKCLESNKPFVILGAKREAAATSYLIRVLATDSEPTNDLATFLGRLNMWEEEAQDRVSAYWYERYKARCDVIRIISLHCQTVQDMMGEVGRIFSSNKDHSEAVILSTIHGAKGGQANRVFHICPGLVPHPRAKQPEEKEQERNAAYVAVTRAKREYHEVPSKPAQFMSLMSGISADCE